jgi:hypothetical protein
MKSDLQTYLKDKIYCGICAISQVLTLYIIFSVFENIRKSLFCHFIFHDNSLLYRQQLVKILKHFEDFFDFYINWNILILSSISFSALIVLIYSILKIYLYNQVQFSTGNRFLKGWHFDINLKRRNNCVIFTNRKCKTRWFWKIYMFTIKHRCIRVDYTSACFKW